MNKKSMKTALGVAALSLLASCSSTYAPNVDSTVSLKGTDVFKADSASIAQNYTIPEWFKDAKFGIFIHWALFGSCIRKRMVFPLDVQGGSSY